MSIQIRELSFAVPAKNHHLEPHRYAFQGVVVTLLPGVTDPRGYVVGGAQFVIYDWHDRLAGDPMNDSNYVRRITAAGLDGILSDTEVLYGHIGPFGHPVHVSEIDWDSAVIGK
jgi:hypothetical protein